MKLPWEEEEEEEEEKELRKEEDTQEGTPPSDRAVAMEISARMKHGDRMVPIQAQLPMGMVIGRCGPTQGDAPIKNA